MAVTFIAVLGVISLACGPGLEAKTVISREEVALTLNILHLNDIHAHFEEVNENTGRCHKEQAENGECYGGMERIHFKVNEIRDNPEFENVLLLNAGDYYQGTIWYTMFKFGVVADFANMLGYDAMGLGNHEFDDSIAGLDPFVDQVNFDIIAANLKRDVGEDGLDQVKKSKVIEIEGIKVGIIGYVTTDTPMISSPDASLEFLDEIVTVRAEAQRLQSEEGVEILIALGHSGYELDQRMAAEIEELDVVVGGHSHTFLYSGTQPSIEEAEGPYPTYVAQTSGKVVPVVQAYCYSKYMGHLTLNFNAQGDLVTDVEGEGVSLANVILLDKTVAKSPEIAEKMEEYRQQLKPYYEEVGQTEVDLLKNGLEESNIGNLLTDSMVDAWNGEVTIGFINNGGIRANLIQGEITGEDIFNVLPFNNTVDKLEMTGAGLKAVLESYIGNVCPDQSCYPGTFLQMSGVKVVYDVYEDNIGNRVTSVQTQCDEDWCDLEEDTTYFVTVPSFLAQGGSRTANFPDHNIGDVVTGMSDYAALEGYVRKFTPIRPTIEGRFVINYYPGQNMPPVDHRQE